MQQPPLPLVLPVRPPVPEPPASPLPAWEVFRRMRRNVITTWPRAAYDEMVLRRRLFGADMLIANEQAMVRELAADRVNLADVLQRAALDAVCRAPSMP